jgi:hypothetical protein
MKKFLAVLALVVANPAVGMTLKPHQTAVWIDYEAMKGGDRLIHAGVNGWDPSRLLPFLSCFAEPGAEITVTATHAFYGYAEVVVASQKCAGVVHLEALDTAAAEARDAEARDAKARDAKAQEQVRICRDWNAALLAEAKEIDAQGTEVGQTVADATLTATGVPISISATKGVSVPVTVATFTDADPNAAVGDFTAWITWGDGVTSTGTITEKNGVFSVAGTHTFEEGKQTASVVITDREPLLRHLGAGSAAIMSAIIDVGGRRGTQGLPIEQNVRAILKLMHTAQADIRLAASRCPALFSADVVAKVDASAKKVEAACESRGFQWCRGESPR